MGYVGQLITEPPPEITIPAPTGMDMPSQLIAWLGMREALARPAPAQPDTGIAAWLQQNQVWIYAGAGVLVALVLLRRRR